MASKPRRKKLFWGSSYDRGLNIVLDMWPAILEKHPDAELHVCYGWNLFLQFFNDNPERMAWMDKMNKLMEQDGITHYGRLGKEKLAEVRQSCGIWLYPTHFQEINCITALQAQQDGLIPVVTDFAALKETVGTGVKVPGDIYLDETRDAVLGGLFSYMDNQEKWEEESKRAEEFSETFHWDIIASKWAEVFSQNE